MSFFPGAEQNQEMYTLKVHWRCTYMSIHIVHVVHVHTCPCTTCECRMATVYTTKMHIHVYIYYCVTFHYNHHWARAMHRISKHSYMILYCTVIKSSV